MTWKMPNKPFCSTREGNTLGQNVMVSSRAGVPVSHVPVQSPRPKPPQETNTCLTCNYSILFSPFWTLIFPSLGARGLLQLHYGSMASKPTETSFFFLAFGHHILEGSFFFFITQEALFLSGSYPQLWVRRCGRQVLRWPIDPVPVVYSPL